MLIIVCGLPGSGKTTVAKALARRFAAEHINSDAVRKKLFARPGYSEEEKLAVYRKMAEEAGALLGQGRNVVADATFSRSGYIRIMKDAAQRSGAPCYMVMCSLSDEQVRKRLAERKKGPSDADFEVYLKLKAEFEPIKTGYLALDASKPMEELMAEVERFIGLMDEKQIGELRESLGRPELITTHISWVLVGREFAYKIKRPVRFSFLDFSTMEKRKAACEDEVALNRRLSPDVYIGVVPVARGNDGRLTFGRDGRILDYAVKMRTLPQERRMDILLKQGRVDAGHIRKIAGIMAAFHKRIQVIGDKRYGSAAVVKRQIDDLGNFRSAIQEACGLGSAVDLVLQRSDGFIGKNGLLFEKRQKEGRIRDCHGDLHSANIFILDNGGIVIFDCIEFNRDFRYVDIASEIAFMAMDLDAFGREDLSELFVGEYLAKNPDPELKTMLGLYKCYRANVRAKVAAIEYMEAKSDEGRERIRKYMFLAERYAKGL